MVSKNSAFSIAKADADYINSTFMCNQFFRKIWDSPSGYACDGNGRQASPIFSFAEKSGAGF